MATKRSRPGSAFGERLLEALEWSGLSKYALEQATGLSDGYVGRLVRGKRNMPRPQTIDTLATALGVRREWLRTGEGGIAPERSATFPKPRITPWEAAVGYLGGHAPPSAVEAVERWHRQHRDSGATAEELVGLIRGVGIAMLRGDRFEFATDPEGRPIVILRPAAEIVHDHTYGEGAA